MSHQTDPEDMWTYINEVLFNYLPLPYLVLLLYVGIKYEPFPRINERLSDMLQKLFIYS